MTAIVELPALAGQLPVHGVAAPTVLPGPWARSLVPTEQELDCQDTAGRLVRLHVVIRDRGRVGLRVAGRDAVLWLAGGGFSLFEGIRSALADKHSRPEVSCVDDDGRPQVIRLGATPSKRIGLLIPGLRSALWLPDALAVAWAARRADSEAQQRARTAVTDPMAGRHSLWPGPRHRRDGGTGHGH